MCFCNPQKTREKPKGEAADCVSDTLISLYIQRKERCGGEQEGKRKCGKENTRKKQKPCHRAQEIVIESNRK